MTAFAFILGVVPLMLANGAGAGAQNVMGTAGFWGMLIAPGLGVFLIPGDFAFVEGLGRRGVPATRAASKPGAPAPVPGEQHAGRVWRAGPGGVPWGAGARGGGIKGAPR